MKIIPHRIKIGLPQYRQEMKTLQIKQSYIKNGYLLYLVKTKITR